MVSWEANHLPNSRSLIHVWAHADSAKAISRSKDLDLQNVVGSLDMKDEKGLTPLDCAIDVNSSGTVEELLKSDCHPRPTKAYLLEDRSPKVVEILRKHCPADPHSLSWELLKGKDAFKA